MEKKEEILNGRDLPEPSNMLHQSIQPESALPIGPFHTRTPGSSIVEYFFSNHATGFGVMKRFMMMEQLEEGERCVD